MTPHTSVHDLLDSPTSAHPNGNAAAATLPAEVRSNALLSGDVTRADPDLASASNP